MSYVRLESGIDNWSGSYSWGSECRGNEMGTLKLMKQGTDVKQGYK